MKKRKLVFDDVDLEYKWHGIGPPVFYTNQNIRRMLHLANITEKDTFFDLGSGYAQNVILALTEFQARKAKGFEYDEGRIAVSKRRVNENGLSEDCKIIEGSFEDTITEKQLRQATVIYYGLEGAGIDILQKIEKAWSKEEPGRRFVYHHKGVFPEIIPDDSDFPFYVSKTQVTSRARVRFRKPRTEYEWLKEIVFQPKETVKRSKPTLIQLWKEFTHNYDVEGTRGFIDENDGLRNRLKRVVSK